MRESGQKRDGEREREIIKFPRDREQRAVLIILFHFIFLIYLGGGLSDS